MSQVHAKSPWVEDGVLGDIKPSSKTKEETGE